LAIRELNRRLRRLEARAPGRCASKPHAEAAAALDAEIEEMLRDLPDPDEPAWGPEHHAVLAKAAALHRIRWAPSAGGQPGHDLMANPSAVVQIARILREAGVG
jgi:hypothetical protein